MKTNKLIEKLYQNNYIDPEELLFLLDNINNRDKLYLIEMANKTRIEHVGKSVYLRALIEFTNYCKNDCMYCGIRKSNKNADRYRLTIDEIITACDNAYNLGYKTFVLQGGEDNYFTDEKIMALVRTIKAKYLDTAVTLSIGEKSFDSYKKFYDAGADRFLLRHETATKSLYQSLHPDMDFDNRMRCLQDLKQIGFQVGAGFMVGLPGASNQNYVDDLMFIKSFKPHMVGIGPFIAHKDTPLNKQNSGTLDKTIIMVALTRLFLPDVLLPATTALGTIDSEGREEGLKAGANVVMPNFTPVKQKAKYVLYDNKICMDDEAVKCTKCIKGRIIKAGFEPDMSIGHHKNLLPKN